MVVDLTSGAPDEVAEVSCLAAGKVREKRERREEREVAGASEAQQPNSSISIYI